MELFKNLGRAMGEAANFLAEKYRRAAQINRIRAVIRLTEKKTREEYIALGRYYYHNLRDKENAVTEPHCAALDQAEKALDAALDKLTEYYSSEDVQEEVTLEDVTAYDQDPEAAPAEAVEPAPTQEVAPAQQETAPEEDNDNLPFEG